MSDPLVVSIPHRLGREEAERRLKSGLAGARANFPHLTPISQETRDENPLTFGADGIGRAASGLIDVRDDHVVLTVQLPWLLAKFAQAASNVISKQGTLMLEKK